MKYYNGNKIRSYLDKNGNLPEIVIVDGNRSSGKTTDFNIFLMEEFLNKNKKFALLYRYKYEISEIADKFFKDIKQIKKYKGEIIEKSCAYGSYHKLFYKEGDNDPLLCGYALAINSAEQIKKQSHEFSDVDYLLFDEFQSESGVYAKNEISKFMSIYTSIARGQGQQHRFVRVFLLSNSVDMLNPYYQAMGINEKLLKSDMRFYRGNGFVLEHNFNKDVADILKLSTFLQALSNTNYYEYLTEQKYINNNDRLIGEIDLSDKYYWCTLNIQGVLFGLFKNSEQLCFTRRVNKDCPYIFIINRDDMETGGIYQKIPARFYNTITNYFDNGKIICEDIISQTALMTII